MGDNLIVFYYLSGSEIWLDKGGEWPYNDETIVKRTPKPFGDFSMTFFVFFIPYLSGLGTYLLHGNASFYFLQLFSSKAYLVVAMVYLNQAVKYKF